MSPLPPIRVSRGDAERLESLLAHLAPERPEVARLEEEIERAEILDEEAVPADLVTMNSRVRYVDEVTGAEREITLVFPHDADAAHGRVSVLAPIGSALLGLSVGHAIEWPVPGGRTACVRVLAVGCQPEPVGHRPSRG